MQEVCRDNGSMRLFTCLRYLRQMPLQVWQRTAKCLLHMELNVKNIYTKMHKMFFQVNSHGCNEKHVVACGCNFRPMLHTILQMFYIGAQLFPLWKLKLWHCRPKLLTAVLPKVVQLTQLRSTVSPFRTYSAAHRSC